MNDVNNSLLRRSLQTLEFLTSLNRSSRRQRPSLLAYHDVRLRLGGEGGGGGGGEFGEVTEEEKNQAKAGISL